MIKEGHFGSREAFSLITIILITKIFYSSPLTIIKLLGTSAWYATLISCGTTLVFFALLYQLMKRFPNRDLYQIFEIVTGKAVGKVLILMFAAYLLYKTGINISEVIAIQKVYSMPFTPPSILIIPLLLVAAVMAYVGLEGIARVANIFFSLVFGGVILILVLAIPSYDFDYLNPIFGYGLQKTMITGITRSAAYDEIVLLAVIMNSIYGLKEFKRVGIASLVVTGLVFSICLACILAAFQFTIGGDHISGMYQLSRVIYFSRFVQRLEAIFLFVWVTTSVITIAFSFYLTISSYCRAFNITNHRPLILPFSFLTFIIAITPESIAEIIEVHVQFLRSYSAPVIYGIPVMVLLIALIRGKKGGKSRGKTA